MDKNSHLARRAVEYGEIVDRYAVVVPGEKDSDIKLSDKVRVYSIGGTVKPVKLVNLYKLAKKILNKEKYGIITVQDQYYLGLIGLCLAKKFKLGLELQVHGFEKYRGLRKLVARYVIPRARAVRVVSQRLKKQLIKEFGVDENRITVVPIFIDRPPDDFIINKKNDKCVFLSVGRLVEVKNIGMQIRAMAEVVKKHKNVELLIVGDGCESEKLEVRSKKLNIENKVKFLGQQADLSKFYQQADVLLLTSNTEGWGLAVIEAANFGLPIIMTDVGCAGELIKGFEHAATNGVHANENKDASGIVIPVGDQRALEKAMIKLIKEPELREKLGQGARRAVEKLPDKEETLKLYKESWQKAKI